MEWYNKFGGSDPILNLNDQQNVIKNVVEFVITKNHCSTNMVKRVCKWTEYSILTQGNS